MVMINSTSLILIGGDQGFDYYSTSTYIFDLNNKKWTQGPELKFGRRRHACARIPSQRHGLRSSIIVVGGTNNRSGEVMSSVEILDEGSNEWRQGPELPIPIYMSVIVEQPVVGVALIGGMSNNYTELNTIYRLPHSGKDAEWELMPQKLKFPRYRHTAFLVPKEKTLNCEN